MYKVGDLVRILPRTGELSQYRFSYTNKMLLFEGQILEIVAIQDSCDSSKREIQDDGKLYRLKETPYNWASSMFEPYDVSKTKEKSIEESTHLFYSAQKESYKLKFTI